MAVLNQISGRTIGYIQMETTNQSFIDMHYYLKRIGRVNNDFFLILYDQSLASVNPRDPMLSLEMKMRVLNECRINYWYFIREVARIPVQGDDVDGGARYALNRANLAMNFLFNLNYNFYVEIPRQWGKTTAMMMRLLWVYNFGTTNSSIALLHKEHQGSKDNLELLKTYRDALPGYLQMASAVGVDGKKLKVKNTVVSVQHPLNNNKIVTFASARSKEAADKMCRGMTIPIQYYDEFAFMSYNKYAYLAAIPAFSKAAQNARDHGSPYGIYISTTPGDLTTEHGRYCYLLRNNASEWSEDYYDYSYEKLEELRLANTKSNMFLIRYTYQQLGGGTEYFNSMCRDMSNDWDRIRREVLIMWSEVADNCAFRKEDLEVIERYCREPIRTIRYGHAGQYLLKIYEDLDPRFPPILGVDVAGAMYQDSSAITVIDSRSTRVVATLNCNFIPSDDLADVLYTMIKTRYPNGIINIERNGGYGKTVVERLKKTSVKKNMYYELKERVVSEVIRTDGSVERNKQIMKVYGLDSTKEVRARLIEILYDRVNYHKDKFIDKKILEEMKSMIVKPSGKVEHSNLSHDDQVFSYLMAMYVWYDGKNVMENYGIIKNTIMTDSNEEIIEGDIQQEEAKKENIDLEFMEIMDQDPDIRKAFEYVEEAKKLRTSRVEFDKTRNFLDDEATQMLFATNKVAEDAYNKKYNIDVFDQGYKMIQLPDQVFMMDGDEDMEKERERMFHGNLYGRFKNFW